MFSVTNVRFQHSEVCPAPHSLGTVECTRMTIRSKNLKHKVSLVWSSFKEPIPSMSSRKQSADAFLLITWARRRSHKRRCQLCSGKHNDFPDPREKKIQPPRLDIATIKKFTTQMFECELCVFTLGPLMWTDITTTKKSSFLFCECMWVSWPEIHTIQRTLECHSKRCNPATRQCKQHPS